MSIPTEEPLRPWILADDVIRSCVFPKAVKSYRLAQEKRDVRDKESWVGQMNSVLEYADEDVAATVKYFVKAARSIYAMDAEVEQHLGELAALYNRFLGSAELVLENAGKYSKAVVPYGSELAVQKGERLRFLESRVKKLTEAEYQSLSSRKQLFAVVVPPMDERPFIVFGPAAFLLPVVCRRCANVDASGGWDQIVGCKDVLLHENAQILVTACTGKVCFSEKGMCSHCEQSCCWPGMGKLPSRPKRQPLDVFQHKDALRDRKTPRVNIPKRYV